MPPGMMPSIAAGIPPGATLTIPGGYLAEGTERGRFVTAELITHPSPPPLLWRKHSKELPLPARSQVWFSCCVTRESSELPINCCALGKCPLLTASALQLVLCLLTAS